MKILILKCADCGTELNRTVPLANDEVYKAKINSAFAGRQCPNGCRFTFKDLNINTRIEEIEAA